jgi:hypothetical protein
VADEPDGHLEAVERELHDAIAQVLGRHELMVTKWLCVAEVYDAAGERALEYYGSPDIRAWDTLGIVGYLDARERGAVGAEAAQSGD